MGKEHVSFNVCLGNPPYQQETTETVTTNGQKSRKNIFHYFQMAADQIASDATCLIYPGGRWIHQSGKGLKQFGLEQINDPKLEKLVFFPESKELFGPAADLADGVTIVIKNQHKVNGGFKYQYEKNGNSQLTFVDNPGTDLLPLDPANLSILNKIDSFVKKNGLSILHDAILPRSLFGIESDFVFKNKEKVRDYLPGSTFDPATEIKLFTNDKAGKAGRAKWFIAKKDVIQQRKEFISEWQVVVSSANAGGQKRDNQLEIIDNHSAYGRARVGLRSFKTQEEAENFFKYIQSYLVRFAFLMTDEALTSLGKKVPDFVDYTSANKYLDFKQDLNDQLFTLFDFDEDERAYIVETVDNWRSKGGA